MSTLNGLKLVISKKQLHASPIVIRRNKLIGKLHEQLALCEAKREGKTYAPLRIKTYVNKATGERMTTEVAKKIKEWFWVSNETETINEIEIFNLYGQKLLHQQNISENRHYVETNNLPAGLYLVSINRQATVKIVVE